MASLEQESEEGPQSVAWDGFESKPLWTQFKEICGMEPGII